MVAHLLQPYVKKGQHLTVDMLLGRGFHTPESRAAAFSKLWEKIEADRKKRLN